MTFGTKCLLSPRTPYNTNPVTVKMLYIVSSAFSLVVSCHVTEAGLFSKGLHSLGKGYTKIFYKIYRKKQTWGEKLEQLLS